MNTQRFSVLMSVYAKEKPEFFCMALDSVFNQTVLPTEVILVVDGPLPDELDAEVSRYEREHEEMKVVRCPVNQGLGRALNVGLQHCTCELVARMDTDDINLPHRFERQLEVFAKHPEIDLCSAWISEFESDPKDIFTVKQLPETPRELYEYGKRRNPVNHPVVMFRRRSVTHNGSYRDYPFFEDYFLWIRMLTNNARFYTIQEPLLLFRASPEMYARRGGWRYACIELRLQMLFYGLRYFGICTMLSNMVIRFSTRIIPRSIRMYLYQRKLRKRC